MLGNCQICWYAPANTDVQLSGVTATKSTTGKFAVADSLCCGYGADGKGSAYGQDCLMIPGAVKGSSPYTAQVKCPKNVPKMSQKCPENVPKMSRDIFGTFLA